MIHRILVALAVCVPLAGVVRADPPPDVAAKIAALEAKIARLEARLKQVEDNHAQYAAALDFLQKVYDQQKQQVDAAERAELAPDGTWAVDIADDIKHGQVAGPVGAPVTIVWAWDFADPYSAKMRPILDELLAEHPGKVRVVYKHMIVHPQVVTHAHLAACAAAKQHKFNEFVRAVWAGPYARYAASRDLTGYDVASLVAVAQQAGLDPKRLEIDMAGPACAALVKADMAELAKFKIDSTPQFFVNGAHFAGAMAKEPLASAVADKLAVAARSGVAPAKYYDQVVMKKGEKQFRSKKDPKP